jgi:16S rRNA (adenine1518-N6/adenine1519-N6)-dimethyltransferase
MLQKEVVDRMVAEPGSKTYGRLSIMTQVYFNISKLFDISPNVFTPRPKVQSSYIRMLPRVSLFESTMYESKFKKLVTLAFTARRKMIKTSLRDYFDESDLKSLSINPNHRPEVLSIEDFLRISKYV